MQLSATKCKSPVGVADGTNGAKGSVTHINPLKRGAREGREIAERCARARLAGGTRSREAPHCADERGTDGARASTSGHPVPELDASALVLQERRIDANK